MPGRRDIRSLTAAAVVLLLAAAAVAGAPEYHRLGARVGLGVEVEGEVNDDGFFVAEDIEPLPKPRRPKLRGPLEAVAEDGASLTLFGLVIRLDEETEFSGRPLKDLRPGRFIEVKCKVEGDGTWRARSVESGDVKESVKIKGTITEMQYDGVAPDTLSIEGLPVLLIEATDYDRVGATDTPWDKDLFGDLAGYDAYDVDDARVFAAGRMALETEYRHNVRTSSDYDLSGRFDSDREDTQPELRAAWSGFWSESFRTHAVARVRKTYVLSSDLDEPSRDAELQVTQAYALWRGLAGGRLAVQVGRQDFDDDREWLYDEYLDGVRVHLVEGERWHLQGSWIHAVSPLKEKLETWTDVHASLDCRVGDDAVLSAWTLRRWDSDEGRNREPWWWGLRFLGEPVGSLDAWADLALMRGEDKHEALRSWAVDVGGTWVFRGRTLRPSLTAGYAFASGDDDGGDGLDRDFRQTGYQDNSARLGGVTSVFYYGALLDPELSNLEILTLGGGVRPSARSSVEVFYHRYRQHHPDDRVRGDLVDPPARPNGQSEDLGWGFDLVVGLPRLWDTVKASWTLALFDPGEAFEPRRERAYLNKINVTVEI